MQPQILNQPQIQFLTDQIFAIFPDADEIYKKDWQERIESANGDLALILQKLFPANMIKVFLEFKEKYPELNYEYVIDFLGLADTLTYLD